MPDGLAKTNEVKPLDLQVGARENSGIHENMALCHLNYFSNALQKQTAAYIIVPEIGTPPYPVLYLLHGLSDDYTIWMRRTSIERYVANLPLMVVMPDGGRGFYCNAEQGFAYGTALGVELPERIEKTFPALARREGRCLAGLSMGGYGAARLALSYPERFVAAVSHSGALGFGHYPHAHDGRPYSPEFERILGPEPTGGPNDLFALSNNSDPDTRPALRIDCGTEDFLIDANRAFHEHLEEIGYPHEYEEFPGGHTWDYWDLHIQETLTFLQRNMGF